MTLLTNSMYNVEFIIQICTAIVTLSIPFLLMLIRSIDSSDFIIDVIQPTNTDILAASISLHFASFFCSILSNLHAESMILGSSLLGLFGALIAFTLNPKTYFRFANYIPVFFFIIGLLILLVEFSVILNISNNL